MQPTSRRERFHRRLMQTAEAVGRRLVPTAVVVGHVGLFMLVATGEAIRWVDYRETLVSAPMLRAAHVLGGFLLVSALAVRLLNPLVQPVVRFLARQRHISRRPALKQQTATPAVRLLEGLWWGVVGLLVLSGLERYAQMRHGASLLPWLSPSAWWAMHRPLLPFLYAILLSNLLIRGRILARQVLSYLYTP